MSALTTDEMREDYIWRNRPRTSKETAAEFDAWLNGVRAEAWDRGHGAPCDQWVIDEMCREYHPNPYRRAGQ